MKVLHVITGLDARAGGPAIALRGLGSAQKDAGLDVSIVSVYAEGADSAPAQDLRENGIDVVRIGPAKPPLMSHPHIRTMLRSMVPNSDVVHIHGLWEDVQHYAARYARQVGVPYIIRPCGMLDPWSLDNSRWKKKLYMAWRLRANLDRAAAIHYTTEAERAGAATLNIPAPSIVEPNGLDLSEFEHLPSRGSFRQHHPAIDGRKMVLFLGRVHPKKGLHLLIPAFARTKSTDAVLVIVGPSEPEYHATLTRLIAEHRLGDRVLLLDILRGQRRIEAMVDADLFILPSRQENFGIAVVEALAAGCPVVVSEHVDLWPEICAAGVGDVVKLELDQIAAGIDRWLMDNSLRRQAAAQAPAFVRDRYDWKPIARHWVDHYDRLCAVRAG